MHITLGLSSHFPANNTSSGAGEDEHSSEVTSSYTVFDEKLGDLELRLGLSTGGGCLKSKGWSQYARILTAKDFQISKNNSCSSSNSGTKRTATDSVPVSPHNGTCVVGWPPVSKAHRMPSLANQVKSPIENLVTEQNKNKNRTLGLNDFSSDRKLISNKKYQSVKVNMDRTPIGRKVDLTAHTSYEMLAHTLEEMFLGQRSGTEAAGHSRLLDGTSEYVLTYEDKDGDCMLVGDVPWQMFLSSVKRLRIMRNSESNELSSKQQEKQN